MLSLFTAAFVLFSAASEAQTQWMQGVPTIVYPQADGSFYIGFNSTAPVCSGSGSTRNVYVAVGASGVTTDGLRNMLATVLMAYAMEKNLAVAYDDASSSCYVNRISMQP